MDRVTQLSPILGRRMPVLVATLLPGGSVVKNPPVGAGDMGLIPGLGRSPGGGYATHSSILAWQILWTEEPEGLQSRVTKSWT